MESAADPKERGTKMYPTPLGVVATKTVMRDIHTTDAGASGNQRIHMPRPGCQPDRVPAALQK
jgi:hypothetical protein